MKRLALVLLLPSLAFAQAKITPNHTEQLLTHARSVSSGLSIRVGKLHSTHAITSNDGHSYFFRLESINHDLDISEMMLKRNDESDAFKKISQDMTLMKSMEKAAGKPNGSGNKPNCSPLGHSLYS